MSYINAPAEPGGPYPTSAVEVTQNTFYSRPKFPIMYPQPHHDDKLLLQAFPRPFFFDGDIAFNSGKSSKILTNVSLIDDFTFIIDDADHSKRVKFEVGDISPNTTRTITVPNANFTLIGQDTSDTLTNKNITGSTNTIGATQFETTGLPVTITGSAPSGPGEALVTTSSTTAAWFPVGGGGGGGGRIAYQLTTAREFVYSTSFSVINTFTWLQSRYALYTNGLVIFSIIIGDRTADIKLRNITTGMDLGFLSGIAGTGIYSFPLTILPTADANLQLQMRKTMSGGINPILINVALEFDQ